MNSSPCAPCLQDTALVVNSNLEEQRAMGEFFERAQYRLLFAETADQAVELCRTYGGPIHLLVADEEMPGSAGWHLAEIACRIRPGLLVLFLPKASVAGLDSGAFTPRALWNVAQAVASRARLTVH
jgi:DNA-binding response OmpR family regulator